MSRPVLLTRPAGQIKATTQALETAGFEVLELPLTAIREPRRPPSRPARERAEQADFLIFTSRNAVHHAARYLSSIRGQIIAIGRGTAAALKERGWTVSYQPLAQSSEALLNDAGAPEFHGHIVIVGGSGGRRQLSKTLRDRGLKLEKLIVYRREGIDYPAHTLKALLRRQPLLVFSSGHGLRQMWSLCQQHRLATELRGPIFVPSQRLCKLAVQLGFRQDVRTLSTMSDEALITALQEWNQ